MLDGGELFAVVGILTANDMDKKPSVGWLFINLNPDECGAKE